MKSYNSLLITSATEERQGRLTPQSKRKDDKIIGQEGEQVGKGQARGMETLKALGKWAVDTWK